jgi:hypothetical protein
MSVQLNNHSDHIYATQVQELLLRAALLKGEPAKQALTKWMADVDLEGELDHGSFRLLPLLYHNLLKQGIVHPAMDRLKGIYRYAWYRNHKLFLELSKVLNCFHRDRISTMVLKGAALTPRVYKNYAIRPMSDMDVLVPERDAATAIELLEQNGWTSPPDRCFMKDLKYRHSIGFTNESGMEFDLHWHPVKDSSMVATGKKMDASFWKTAVPIKVTNEPTLAPGLPESLFLVIIHGAWYNIEPPIRWIADALFLIRTFRAETDWQRFVFLVKKYHVHLRAVSALYYLDRTFQAGVPRQVFEELERLPVSVPQRIVFHCSLGRPGKKRYAAVGRVPGLVDYLRASGERSWIDLAAGFPGYAIYSMYQKTLKDLVHHFFPK